MAGTSANYGTINTGTDSYYEPAAEFDAQCAGISCCDNYRRWVVNVADGATPKFSWGFRLPAPCSGGTWVQGSFDLLSMGYSQSCDPDVVIARKNNGDHYALVVGISESGSPGFGRILVNSFKWVYDSYSTGEFILTNCGDQSKYVGITWPPDPSLPNSNSGVTKGRVCKSPNVDANSVGQISIVWVEEENVQVIVKWGWPYDFEEAVNVKKGNVYALNGHIDGTELDGEKCLCETSCGDAGRVYQTREFLDGGTIKNEILTNSVWIDRLGYNNICGGMQIGTPFELQSLNLLTYFAQSDVSVGEPFNLDETNYSIVSYTFKKLGFNPDPSQQPLPFGLVVTQHDWANCYLENALDTASNYIYPTQLNTTQTDPYWRKTGFGGTLGGAPRIASPGIVHEKNYRDWTITMASNGGYCDHDEGDIVVSPLRIWGRRDEYYTNNGVDINLSSEEQSFQNSKSVVSYWNINPDVYDRFNVAWAASEVRNTSSETDPGRKLDVIVKSFELGVNTLNVGTLIDFPSIGINPIFPSFNGNYSIVNKELPETQSSPSIASRKFGSFTNFLTTNTSTGPGGTSLFKIACNSSISQALAIACINISPEEEGGPKGHSGIRIEPNPTEGTFTIQLQLKPDEKWISYSILDSKGKEVARSKGRSGNHGNTFSERLNSQLARGLYLIKVITNKGERTEKIVLE